MEVPETLQPVLQSMPARPGVYLMRDAEGRVIYVGKAVNLASRVRSYFTPSAQENPKTRRLVAEVASLEFIVTDSELEALILEANLIKAHRPRFNVRLRDDKRYPYIKVTWAEPYPRVLITRRIERDGSRYFGPYTSSDAVRETLDLLRRTFPYLTCSRIITGKDPRACLYYDMKLCLAPCIGAVSQEEYRAMIAGLVRFLEGRSEEVLVDLERRMREAAERLDFERAARLRDQLQAARRIVERQKIVAATGRDQDVIAFARDNGNACVQVFFIRDGKLLGREYFLLEGAEAEDDQEVMAAFLKQFYEEAAYVPPEVLLPEEVDEALVIEEWLRSKRGAKVVLRVPRRGRGRDLLRMAAENAAQMLATFRAGWEADAHRQEQALEELRQALGLPARPARMECYDVSTTQGAEPTASMVVFEQGVPRKSEYRRFALRALEKPDDYAGMREVLTRRLERWRTATSGELTGVRGVRAWALLPDLLVVDGGKGQLGVALEVLESFGLRDRVAVAALAKEEEALFLPGREEPVRLPEGSPGLRLLQQMRDEAHRFAVAYHRLRRERAGLATDLENIPGVGPARRRILLKTFGSLEHIRAATVEELAAVPGIPRAVAEAIKKYLTPPPTPSPLLTFGQERGGGGGEAAGGGVRPLSELAAHLPLISHRLGPDPQVGGIAADSRRVRPGDLFVAIPGGSLDGHAYIPQALAAGAVAVVGQRAPQEMPDLPWGTFAYLQVPDARQAWGWLCAAWEGLPGRRMTLVGVTGTDGKTTTVTLIHAILRAAGLNAGLVSTVAARIGEEEVDTGFHTTTPDPPDLQRYLARMVQTGATHAVLEVTSHGLAQHRVAGCDFDVAVVTNITHEHLDFHGSLEAYRQAKAMLFEGLSRSFRKPGVPKVAVLNRDDSSYDLLRPFPADRHLTYSRSSPADVTVREVRHGPDATRLTLNLPDGPLEVTTSLVGAYNVSNILAAAAAAVALGIPAEAIARGVAAVRGVPGRMERIDEGQDFLAIVDFAHTPNALEQALRTAREMAPGRVIVVFGCAGLRDRQKRTLMGRVAGELADVVVVTAEDPRTEDLEEIMAVIAAAAREAGKREGVDLFQVPDRGEAILRACQIARPGDVVIACGKGHEQSMCFGTVEYPWDDREAMRRALHGQTLDTLPTASAW